MTVDYRAENGLLAGSEPINSTPGGESDTATPLDGPGANAGQDDAPKRRGRGPAKPKPGVLVLTCAHCRRAIIGSGAGYAYVSLADASKTAQRAAVGYVDPVKARWTLAHRGCAPEALAPMSPHFRLWTERITTTDDLLDAMVTLSRQPWFAWSDWGSLARGILSDTETAATDSGRAAARRKVARGPYAPAADAEHGTRREYNRGCRCDDCRAANTEQNRANRDAAKQELVSDDPRHGTMAGYDYCGCRCSECCYAKSETARKQYAAKASANQEIQR